MMVMPKCNEPSPAAKAAAEAKKKEQEAANQPSERKPSQKKSAQEPLPYQKQIYPVDSFYQKLIDIQYVIYEDEKTIALKQLKQLQKLKYLKSQ